MDTYMLIIISVVVASVSAWGETAPPGKQCGVSRCLGDPEGVECIDLQCRCPQAYVGNGRFHCGKADESCVCTLYGDPFVQAFGGSVVRVPYPCRFSLGTMSTPVVMNKASCTLTVTALATYNPDLERLPQSAFISGIQISGRAHKGQSYEFGAIILEQGFVNKEFKVVSLPVFGSLGGGIGVECYHGSDGYFTFSLEACGIKVGFRPSDHSVYIQVPTGSTSQGLCQTCTSPSDFYVTAAANASVTPAVLGSFLSALDIVTNNDLLRSLNPNEAQCATLKETLQSCQAEGLSAVKACSFLYLDLSLGKYLLQQNATATLTELSQMVLKIYSDCVENLCTPSSTLGSYCSTLYGLIGAVSFSDIRSQEYWQSCSSFW